MDIYLAGSKCPWFNVSMVQLILTKEDVSTQGVNFDPPDGIFAGSPETRRPAVGREIHQIIGGNGHATLPGPNLAIQHDHVIPRPDPECPRRRSDHGPSPR